MCRKKGCVCVCVVYWLFGLFCYNPLLVWRGVFVVEMECENQYRENLM